MITARQKVLAYLKKTRTASTRGIARALKMSAPNVRHHLSVLCSDGRVEAVSTRGREGRGRPEKVYSLSQAALGDNLSALADALLTQTGTRVKMEAVANHILDPSQFANLPITKRLGLMVEKLNDMNYQARWEAGAQGPRVIFGRCPYAQVIEAHPELCKMDAAMLSNVLSRPIAQSMKSEANARGLCPLVFKVR